MSSAPSISVALATYNGERYLPSQLDSILAQTMRPHELVAVDDGSGDGTLRILESYAARAPFPFRIFRNEARLGWRGNFVKATGLCGGDLVALCDQDDVWYADKLATMARHFDDHAVLLAYHNADLIDEDGAVRDTLRPIEDACRRIGAGTRSTIYSNPFGLTIVFRRWLTRFNDLWPQSIDLSSPGHPAAHDQWFYFWATNIGDVVSEPARLLGYRQHAGNVVGWEFSPRSRALAPDDAAVLTMTDRALRMLIPFCDALGKASARETGPLRQRLEEARSRNEALMDRLRTRDRLYRSPRFIERLLLFGKLCANHDYDQRGRWGLGRRALIADATVGLFRRRSG